MSGGLAFRLQRLRSMSPAEVAWRVEQRLSLGRFRRRMGAALPALEVPAGGLRRALAGTAQALGPAGDDLEARCPGEPDRVRARAQAIESGRIELFARTYDFGKDPASWPWNRDPDGGPESPPTFGPTLDYRDPALVGDARRIWELGRFGWLVPPAQAAWLDGDPGHARFVFAAIEAFLAACPPYRGIQWVSGLEFALRSLSWGTALGLVARSKAGDAIEESRWERVLAAWAEQLRFVEAHDSRYSSANNHRLGEAAGLAFGGHLLAFVPGADRWRARGVSVLEDCFLEQTTPGGVTREHAFAYQHFVLDFVVAVEALELRSGRAIPAPVRERLVRVARSLDVLSPGGVPWPVGDGDEGQALPFGEPYGGRVAGSVEAALLLVGEPAGADRSPRAFWLGIGTSPAAAGPSATGKPGDGPHVALDDAGYTVWSWATPRGEARLLLDAAPLGLAPLYAHGHADALELVLDVRGPRLVDSGTGAYHAKPELRNALRATTAHDTVAIDDLDSSLAGGLFQWLRASSVERLSEPDPRSWVARAQYALARGEATVTREVFWQAADLVVVFDTVEATGGRAATVRWHVGDGVFDAPGTGSATRRARWSDGFLMSLAAFGPRGSELRVEETRWAPRFLEPRHGSALALEAPLGRTAIGCLTLIALGELALDGTHDGDKHRVSATTRATRVDLQWTDGSGSDAPGLRVLDPSTDSFPRENA